VQCPLDDLEDFVFPCVWMMESTSFTSSHSFLILLDSYECYETVLAPFLVILMVILHKVKSEKEPSE
jgi:hypothetical protein